MLLHRKTYVTLVDELSDYEPIATSCEAGDDDGIIFPSHLVFTDQHAQAVRAVRSISPSHPLGCNEAVLYRDFMSKAVEEAAAKRSKEDSEVVFD